jgi:nicotinate-nucleotide pyrophosphorylase (carboxylating)
VGKVASAATPFQIEGFDLERFVSAMLAEDIGRGDITSTTSVPAGARLSAAIVTREAVVPAGLPIVAMAFQSLDPSVAIKVAVDDGIAVSARTVLMTLDGDAQALLAAERSALNCLQHLSGIATLTRAYVERLAGTGCTLLDTRKTTPGLRLLAKYATRVGGATNHRLGLDDGILVKDNHIAAAGSMRAAVARAAGAATGLPVQVEVDRIDQIEDALAAGADRLLCDNMDTASLREAVRIVAGRVPIEASGGVTLETLSDIGATGVDFVSVGRITQSAPAADIGLDFWTPAVAPGALALEQRAR